MRTYAENAITAKIWALYGKRITPEQYGILAQKTTVSEIAGYLQQETPYAATLGGVKEDLIHHRQLERLLRQHVTDLYLRLERYSFGEPLISRIYRQQMEIRQLLQVLRLLESGAMETYVTSFPAYLNLHVGVDLFALAAVQDFDGFLEVLRHTEYYRLLGPYRPVAGAALDIPGCEAALLNHLYRNAFQLIEKEYRGKAQEDLLKVFQLRVDLHNLQTIYRMKRFFHASPEVVVKQLILRDGRLPNKIYRKLLDAGSDGELLTELQRTPYLGKQLARAPEGVRLEWTLERMEQVTCRKLIRYSVQPVVVLVCYMTLLEIEVNNLVNLVEATRYGIPAEELYQMLMI